MSEFDLLVIGSGPSGQRAAIQAAKLGKRVAVIEQRAVVGGVTAHTGTIPSKTLREAVLYLSGWRQKGFYGQGYRVKEAITIEDLIHRLELTVQQQIEIIQHQLHRNGVAVVEGQAKFVGPHELLVENGSDAEIHLKGEKIIVATGTIPRRPDNIPFDDRLVIDSDGILNMDRVPRSLTVVGAGVIGIEYASILSALDIKVTVIDGRDSMLGFLDEEIVDELKHDLRDRGITLRLGEQVDRVDITANDKIIAHLASGKRVSSELMMVAAGRHGATDSLELDAAGLGADASGRLKVDQQFQTAVPHIYAVGDVIGFPALASTSAEQGRRAACHALKLPVQTTTESFPFGIYAVPEISTVGKTEHELKADGIPYEIGIARLRETARGQIMGLRQGVLKLLFGLEEPRPLLGVHIIGEGATELVHIGQSVLSLGGGLGYFLETVFNYPTLAEAYKIAALDAHNRIGH